MTISKTLFTFAKRIDNVDALNNPQEYLGPYTDKLLNFWSLLDTLTEDQLEAIEGRYWDFRDNQWSEWDKATDEAVEASNETIGEEFANGAAYASYDVYDVYEYHAAYYVTRELIGGVEKPVFLPMFNNL